MLSEVAPLFRFGCHLSRIGSEKRDYPTFFIEDCRATATTVDRLAPDFNLNPNETCLTILVASPT